MGALRNKQIICGTCVVQASSKVNGKYRLWCLKSSPFSPLVKHSQILQKENLAILLAIKWLIAEILKRFNNVLCRNCVSHYINLQALRQTTTTASHYVLLWRCLHLEKIKIQGFSTFLFSILIPFKEKKSHNKPNSIFTIQKSPHVHLHWTDSLLIYTSDPWTVRGGMERGYGWMESRTQRSQTTIGTGADSPPWWCWEGDEGRHVLQKTTHCLMAKPRGTSLPSTVPHPQSNIKPEIAT